MHLTLKAYLKSYKQLWGILAGCLGCSGPLLGLFHTVTPPEEGGSLLSTACLLVALLIPYVAIQAFHLSSKWLDRVALVLLILGLSSLVFYLMAVYPTYVFKGTIQTANSQRIFRKFWATEDGYNDDVKSRIKDWRSQGKATSRSDIVMGYNSKMEEVFRPEALADARMRVVLWFLAACLLIELGFCSLVAAESVRKHSQRPRSPTPAPPADAVGKD